MTVDNDIIVKNPFGFQLAGVIQNTEKTRQAITKEQMKNRVIDINHQLQRTSWGEYIIEPTKTNAGSSHALGTQIQSRSQEIQ